MSINYQTINVQRHVMTYFMIKYPKITIIDLSPKVKAIQLGGPIGEGKRRLKQWSIGMARTYLLYHKQPEILFYLDCLSKKDDIGDTVVQVEGFCKMVCLPITDLNYDVNAGSLLPPMTVEGEFELDIEIDFPMTASSQHAQIRDYLTLLR
jgi:hypothetical protein